jgi:hypothetical protein
MKGTELNDNKGNERKGGRGKGRILRGGTDDA